jgi:MFS family permease
LRHFRVFSAASAASARVRVPFPFLVSTSTSPAAAPRPLSLGVIFLTLFLDLVGFSIIFPLFPEILRHYLEVDGQSGLLRTFIGWTDSLSAALGQDDNFKVVLFGGILSSLYALLQFVCAPLWGALSDRIGRRPVLLWTVAGTALSYVIWALSGSFWLFIAARLLGGAFGGNLSVATAAVADVTSRAERSRAMGLVGAAFGLGLVTGPAIGAFTAAHNLLDARPALAAWGVNPFTLPAMFSLALGAINLVWVARRFHETLPPAARAQTVTGERIRNPLAAIFTLGSPAIRQVNVVAFLQALAFCAMEFSLVFLAFERFGYGPFQNGLLIGFLGVFSILTQGVLVRRLLKTMPEIRVLTLGLAATAVALVLIGLASTPALLYLGLALVAIGSGLVNPSTSGLISLYAAAEEQGRALGVFRSLGSLARAITPLIAGVVFWTLGSLTVFGAAAAFSAAAWWLALKLPAPKKE